MSVDSIVADDNPLLDFISIKNLNLNLNNKVSVNYLEVFGRWSATYCEGKFYTLHKTQNLKYINIFLNKFYKQRSWKRLKLVDRKLYKECKCKEKNPVKIWLKNYVKIVGGGPILTLHMYVENRKRHSKSVGIFLSET